jgi:hypothetical protein
MRSRRQQAKRDLPPVATSGDIQTRVLAGIVGVTFSMVKVADAIVGVAEVFRGIAPI